MKRFAPSLLLVGLLSFVAFAQPPARVKVSTDGGATRVDYVPSPATIRLFPKQFAAELANDPAPMFKTCDALLPTLLSRGAYQASQAESLRTLAIGHELAVKAGDAVRANKYARKAVAVGLGLCRDYQKDGKDARQVIGEGDGTRTRFALPKSPIAASLSVYTSPASWISVTRAASGELDTVSYYLAFLKVDDDQIDADQKVYQRGTDYDRDLCGENQIHWLANGRRPAAGATYQIRGASYYATAATGWTLDGQDIVFATAPAVGKVVFAECVFNDLSQTGANDGGLSNAMVDSGYASRYLRNLVYTLDWMRGAPAVEAVRAEIESRMVGWADYLASHGYAVSTIQSNYGCGHYSFRGLTAVALNHERLKAETLAFRTATVLPQMRGPTPSLKGGWWAEGWGYGDIAAVELLETGDALQQAGWIDGKAELDWKAEVRDHLATACPVRGVAPGAGDYYAYPPPAPARMLAMLGALPEPAPFHLAEGTGFAVARGGASGIYSNFIGGTRMTCDHQQMAPGHSELWRKTDALLITADNVTRTHFDKTRTAESNTLVLNDTHGLQNYPFNTGFWYGTPGAVVLAKVDTPDYAYVVSDLKPAWSHNTAEGKGGPCADWTCYWLMHRTLGFEAKVHRLKVVNADCYRAAHVHFAPGEAPTVTGNTAVTERGASRVQVTGLSDASLTTTPGVVKSNNGSVPQIKFVGANDRTDCVLITVAQVGPAGSALPVPTWVADGCQVGNVRLTFTGNAVAISTVAP